MAFRLTHPEILQIYQSLGPYLKRSGSEILGAQLGQLVKRAIYPRSIQSVGGLKSLVSIELSDGLEIVGTDGSDTIYCIKAPLPAQLPSSSAPLASPEFWDGFSNPNIDCLVGYDPGNESVFVGPASMSLPSEAKLLSKMCSEEYRVLAKTFAEDQPDPGMKASLLETLDHPTFYPKWIATLRAKRTASANYVKSWEIVRTELVVERLQKELEQAGASQDRARMIVNEVRPKPSHVPRKVTTQSLPSLTILQETNACAPEGESNELQELRTLLHKAIDRMPLADLKDIRVPAGLLLELLLKPAD